MADPSPGEPEERPESLREWVVLLLRDLAVLGLIVAIAFGALFAYAGVWPPMVVVESSSMQHNDAESSIGAIDTGDYVLVQAAPLRGQVVTWAEARLTGYATYGDFGDVIIFWPPGARTTPIIHRALLYLQWNATTDDGWDAPDLLRLAQGTEWTATRNGSVVSLPYNINGRITLYHAGFRADLAKTIFVSTLPHVSGYITMGDNNAYRPGGGPDPWIIPQESVIGRARGELPWFGLIKLTLAPEQDCCRGWGDPRAPRNSWDALAVTLIGLIVGPLAADFGLSWWLARRKAATKGPAPEAAAPEVEPAGSEPGAGEDRAGAAADPPPEGPSH